MFLNNFDSLLGPGSSTVRSLFSEVVRKVLMRLGPGVVNLPHHPLIFELAPVEHGCSANNENLIWEINLCNLEI